MSFYNVIILWASTWSNVTTSFFWLSLRIRENSVHNNLLLFVRVLAHYRNTYTDPLVCIISADLFAACLQEEYSILMGPQIVLYWLPMRNCFQSSVCPKHDQKQFLVDSHCKTIGGCIVVDRRKGKWFHINEKKKLHKKHIVIFSESVFVPLLPVADPGFSPGGRQLPKVLLFFNFLPKTAWKWKNLDPQGGARVPGAPPWIRQWVH